MTTTNSKNDSTKVSTTSSKEECNKQTSLRSSSSTSTAITDDDKTANNATDAAATATAPADNTSTNSDGKKHPNPDNAANNLDTPPASTMSAVPPPPSSQINMCLAPCHRFHTNPAVSSPKHFIQSLTMTNPYAPSSSSTNLTNNRNNNNNNNSSTYHNFSNSNSLHSVHNTKAMKRKQRLAQYKAQTNSNNGLDNATNPNNLSSNNNNENAASATNASQLDNTNSNNSSGNNTNSIGGLLGVGDSSSCHVKWAPNLNYIKNVELVAIASPLTSTDQHHNSSSALVSSTNNNSVNPVAAAASSVNNASTVFVLVFDEGIFSHNGDFSLSSELCDLFGLPTQNLLQPKHYDYGGGKDGNRNGTNYNENFIHDNQYEEEDDENKVKFGLRRRVFHNQKKRNRNNNETTMTTMNPIQETNEANTSQTTKTHFEKIEASIQKASNTVIKPLLKHVSHEIENSIQILRSEIIGDGRIHNPSPLKGYALSKRKMEEVTAELVYPEHGHSTKASTSASVTNNSHNHHAKGSHIGSDLSTTTTSMNDIHKTTKGGTKECPIKPTLVFRINLPYSTTSMEIMNIEWNADGTCLCIVQRRKGFSSSSSTSSSAGNHLACSSNVTNKKKKNSNHSSSNQNHNNYNQNQQHNQNHPQYQPPPPVSPGNTAVSFWCIPPWLQVDYEEMKMPYENEDVELCEDRLIIKANNTCHDCGWEVEDNDENRSLFPLWEWYLAKYVFKDEVVANKELARSEGLKTKIMMKNMMDQNAYAMELAVSSNSNGSGGSSSTNRHGKKSTTRGGRGSSGAVENINAMMNGDVTCLFWEDTTPEDEKHLGPDAYKERLGNENDHLDGEDDIDDKNSISDLNEVSSQDKKDDDSIIAPSKWIAIGTSKGQIILHNSAASFLSNYSRKAKSKPTGTTTASSILSSMSTQSRTVTVPVRHKKRVTCGAWVDNLLVFGYVGTGCLTLVSTFPKMQQRPTNDGNSTSSRFKQEILDPLFVEKTAKVLGNIMLPGGRDAVNIKIGNIEYEGGSLTVLSVNCEEKCLLFYTFPKLTEDSNSGSHSDITSSPAMEVSFAMSSTPKAMDIMYHKIIPNSFLAVVAFSSGYIALVDWAAGLILSDRDVSILCQDKAVAHASKIAGRDVQNDDNFLQDVAFHLPTCTAACLTSTGVVVIYHVRIRDRCDLDEDLKEENIIFCRSKKHTRPKTKSSSSQNNDEFIDRKAMMMMGTIDILCTRKLNGPKGLRVNFSADGESVSVSLGDESVSIFSIKTDDEESNGIKERLAHRIFLFTPFQIRMVFHIAFCILLWIYYHNYGG